VRTLIGLSAEIKVTQWAILELFVLITKSAPVIHLSSTKAIVYRNRSGRSLAIYLRPAEADSITDVWQISHASSITQWFPLFFIPHIIICF
jgi:hypothetical protein